MTEPTLDIIVVGSGAAGLSAALTAAIAGAKVLVLEKSEWLGGTSAMSGGAVWIPANHIARAAGVEDSPGEALEYLRATAPEGWHEIEDALWASFVENAPAALELVDRETPIEFTLTPEPDPMAEYSGGKRFGRMISPRAMRRGQLGNLAKRLRRSTLPHLFTYVEAQVHGPYAHPLRAGLALWPKLLWRWLTGARGQGNALVTGLAHGVLAHGGEIRLDSAARELVRNEVGAVTGVVVERAGQRETLMARRAVILATGGFEWNQAWRETHFPGPFDRIGSPDTNTGDGHAMAAAVGAALDRMDQANVYATLPTRYEGRIHGMPTPFHASAHAIMVNRHGARFVSEFDYNAGEALDAREPDTGAPVHLPCWMIADQQFIARSGMFRWYARKLPGWVRRAPDLRRLAHEIELDPDTLEATVARYNAFARAGRDEDFHRGETIWDQYKSGASDDDLGPALGTVERGPFIAVPVNRSILVTKGGPRTDANGQVLREDGSAIGGLYCAGVAMANPLGTRSVGAGTTLGPCITWGYICAQSAMRSNR